ncbi:MAG: ATP-binding cassette domain-containing protein, partial [Candidatus Sungbacteria bacterium]|nr:ATP-binding cassette domain-containing protein [Candidatus Sungbacteria bacterium]
LMPYQGKVTWASDAKIGYVPQRFHVAKTVPLTVREFFLLHEPSFLFAGKLFDRKIRRALAMVKVDPHNLTERLGNLSGGELQRVLIAWALYDRPNILLFDEPTAGIDVSGEETIYNLLHSLQDQLGITIILVSHELNVVYRYATFVLCLNKKLLCFGEPHTVLTAEQLKELYGQPTHYHHLHETAENVSAAGNSH